MEAKITITYIGSIVCLGLGFALSKIMERLKSYKVNQRAKRSAQAILKEAKQDAENIKKDKILQAKEKFIELKTEHEKVILSRDKKIADAEKRARDKESLISSELAKNKNLNRDL